MIRKKTKGNYPVWFIASLCALAGLFFCIEKFPAFQNLKYLPLTGITCGIVAGVAVLTVIIYYLSKCIVLHMAVSHKTTLILEGIFVSAIFIAWMVLRMLYYGNPLTLAGSDLYADKQWTSLYELGFMQLQQGVLFLFGQKDQVIRTMYQIVLLVALVALYFGIRVWVSRLSAILSTLCCMSYLLIYSVSLQDMHFYISLLLYGILFLVLGLSFRCKRVFSITAVIAGILAGLLVMHSAYAPIVLVFAFLFYLLQERKSNWVPLWFLLGMVLGCGLEILLRVFALGDTMSGIWQGIQSVYMASPSWSRLIGLFPGTILWIVLFGVMLFGIPGVFLQGKTDLLLPASILWIWTILYCFVWAVPGSYEASVTLVSAICACAGLCSCIYRKPLEAAKEPEVKETTEEPSQNAPMDGITMLLPKRKMKAPLEFPLEDVKMEYDYEVAEDADYDY